MTVLQLVDGDVHTTLRAALCYVAQRVTCCSWERSIILATYRLCGAGLSTGSASSKAVVLFPKSNKSLDPVDPLVWGDARIESFHYAVTRRDTDWLAGMDGLDGILRTRLETAVLTVW